MSSSVQVSGESGWVPRQSMVPPRSQVRKFYVAITFGLIAMVVWGFWVSYFGPLLSGAASNRPWIVHLHAAIFSGWMLLLLAQVLLVAKGRVQWHRRLGVLGAAYGALIFVNGLIVAFAAPLLKVRSGEWTVDQAASFLILPLPDMLLFAGFFGAAIVYRRKPELHKRLVLAATVTLMLAAAGRLPFPVPVLYLLWMSPMFAAMAFDLFTRRRIHPVHFPSACILSLAFLRVPLMESEGWLRIGRALLAPFLGFGSQ